MNFIKYKISISRVEQVATTGRQYQKIADSGNKDNGAVYGYVEYPSTENRETEILKQEIADESLDIKAVIKAINGL